MSPPIIPVIIPAYRQPERLRRCLDHLARQTWPVEVFVRDNSTDNIYFTAAVNEGLRRFLATACPAMLVLNQDMYLAPDAVEQLWTFMDRHPRCGIAAPVEAIAGHLDGLALGGGLEAFPWGRHRVGPVAAFRQDERLHWANGACLLLRRELIEEIGLLDRNLKFICSDADYCLTARARGWQVWRVGAALGEHEPGGTSTGSGTDPELERRKAADAYFFARKWLTGDLYRKLGYEGAALTPEAVAEGVRRLRGESKSERTDTERHFSDISFPIKKQSSKNRLRLAAVSMVKNECDIIELFIKVNLRTFDHIYILDHRSDDATPEIIGNLQAAGYPVSRTLLSSTEYDQKAILTQAVRELANYNIYDFIMPLDADEFLYSESKVSVHETLEKYLDADNFGMIPWNTYVPIKHNFYSAKAPLYENFRRREIESPQYYKVILGSEFAKSCSLTFGSHNASRDGGYDGRSINPVVLPLILQHVPIRSQEQIVRKAVLASYAMALYKNRKIGEAYHWDLMTDKIRLNNYRISDNDLVEMAFGYSAEITKKVIDDKAARIGCESDCIEFKELASIDILKSFDHFIRKLVDELKLHGGWHDKKSRMAEIREYSDYLTNEDAKVQADTEQYVFSNNWFLVNAKPVWDRLIPELKPRKILEIGSYEGASVCYLIEQSGTDGHLEIHCVDTWVGGIEAQSGGYAETDMNQVEKRFRTNIRIAMNRGRHPVELFVHKHFSDRVLPELMAEGKIGYFDMVYIDGSHQAPDVLCDALLGFRLLRVGGLMIFDDYLWSEPLPGGPDLVRCPKPAIDAFTTLYCRKIRIIPAPLCQLYLTKISD